LLGVALALFVVGYAAMSRYVANAGAFYSYLAQGLGRESAVGGAFVALISYNAIQIGLYGLFGAAIEQFISDKTGFDMPWWAWELCAWVVVGRIARRPERTVLAVFLTCEIAVTVYDIVALAHPASGVSAHGFSPSKLFVHGVGAVRLVSPRSSVSNPAPAMARKSRIPAHSRSATYCAWGLLPCSTPSRRGHARQRGPDQLQPQRRKRTWSCVRRTRPIRESYGG
jgi:hypothetical protein